MAEFPSLNCRNLLERQKILTYKPQVITTELGQTESIDTESK